ncbi:MAG: type II toxin-antitoxin system PemK/MazF family toxin, partial [Pseudonocardiaceae bacterium]
MAPPTAGAGHRAAARGDQRPAIVVSADGLNRGASGLVIVVPLTTTRRDLPLHVEVEPETSGLDE